MMCSYLSLSLTGSLIYQLFVTISAFNSKGEQGTIFHNINRAVQYGFQIDNHSRVFEQADTYLVVVNDKQVHVAFRSFLASCERSEEPGLPDGLRLEVFGYHFCYYLSGRAHDESVFTSAKLAINSIRRKWL